MAQDPTGIKGAAQVANSPQSRKTRDAADVLARMRERLEQSLSAYSESRDSELDDLREGIRRLAECGGALTREPNDTLEDPLHLAMCVDPEGNEFMLTQRR